MKIILEEDQQILDIDFEQEKSEDNNQKDQNNKKFTNPYQILSMPYQILNMIKNKSSKDSKYLSSNEAIQDAILWIDSQELKWKNLNQQK